ncbi:MAG: glycosyltransferase family 9 protein [Deltaproteobacteria bacterium]|nr:glycosyltransferase family 9 protein [Deltaproteobacteria bacterium]
MARNEHRGYRNVLVIQLGDIGDVVLATPTFRALKTRHPDARISALVRRPYGSLLSADPHLHEVLEAGKGRGKLAELGRENLRLFRHLRGARYDLVIDLRTGDRGALLALLTGASEKVAYRGDGARWRRFIFDRLIPELVPAPPPAHPGGDQSLRILRAIGIGAEDSTPRLYISPDDAARVRRILSEIGLRDGDRWVTINPFSRWKYKEWGYGKWGEMIDRLWEGRRIRSLLIGSADEGTAAEEIIGPRRGRAFHVAGRTTLGELAALLSMSTLHAGVDSAAPHIAAAVGTATVTIFGPSDWRSWTVVDARHRIVAPEMPCLPCHRKGCDGTERSLCLEELEAERVVRTAFEVLDAAGGAGRI